MAKMIRKDLEAKLAALNGAEWDSMSEDSMGDEVTPEDIEVVVASDGKDDEETGEPPVPPRRSTSKTGKRVGKKVAACVVPLGPAGQPSGVIYIGHIPHGFYEEAMNGFFKQFGDVVRLRIARSKKSTRCKRRHAATAAVTAATQSSMPVSNLHEGYAFVEFSSPEVAGIVAETMDGYRLFGKQLVCRVLKYDQIHPTLFDRAGVKFKKVNWHGLRRKEFNADRTPDKDKKHVEKLLARDTARRKKFAALGIDYDFPGFVASLEDRQVAEVPSQEPETAKTPKGKGGQDSDSKKRKGEKIASLAVNTSPDEHEQPSSVSKKTKTGTGAKPADGGPRAKHTNPVSVTSSKTTRSSRAKRGTSKTSPPPETNRVESKMSAAAKPKANDRKPASVGQRAVDDKVKGTKKTGTKTPFKEEVASDGVLKTPVFVEPTKGNKKTKGTCSSSEDRGSTKKNLETPRKVKGRSDGLRKSPVSGESREVESSKGSASKGSSSKRKNSRTPVSTGGAEASPTAVHGTETQSSGGKMAKTPKRAKKSAQQDKKEACLPQAALPSTGSKLPKRNKRSRS